MDTPDDMELLVHDSPEGSHMELRLWLRLLSCTNLISDEIRRRLRNSYDVTLPRFDVMAQLQREPQGLRLGDLSRRMMVTGGNLTGVLDRLVAEGLVARAVDPDDRRAVTVRLTKAGETMFRLMASEHEGWVGQMFDQVSPETLERLLTDLHTLKSSVKNHLESEAQN